MEERAKSGIVLALLLVSMSASVLNIQAVRGWTGWVAIRADGSIMPADAPISSVANTTYVLGGSILGSVVVERDDIVIDGAGYTLQGTGRERKGIDLAGRTNVTVQNIQIQNFGTGIDLLDSSGISIIGNNITASIGSGIHLIGSSGNIIIGNNVTDNHYGIDLDPPGLGGSSSSNNIIIGNTVANSYTGIMGAYSSNNNNVSGNVLTDNDYGIVFSDSSGNVIVGNNMANNRGGIVLNNSSNNIICGNKMAANTRGVELSYSFNNSVTESNIIGNAEGIWLQHSYGNMLYHNYFIYNILQVSFKTSGYANVWDNGYISGGNYWSDYVGVDEDKDGFGDAPYTIDAQNVDRYPLMSYPPIADVEPPILSIISPYSGEVIRSLVVTISWEGIDYASGISHYTIRIDGGYSTNVGLNTSCIFADLENGQHVVEIAAFDNAGNSVYEALEFTTDAGVRLGWPPYVTEVVVTIAMVIALGITVYVLKSRFSFGTRKPSRKLVR